MKPLCYRQVYEETGNSVGTEPSALATCLATIARFRKSACHHVLVTINQSVRGNLVLVMVVHFVFVLFAYHVNTVCVFGFSQHEWNSSEIAQLFPGLADR